MATNLIVAVFLMFIFHNHKINIIVIVLDGIDIRWTSHYIINEYFAPFSAGIQQIGGQLVTRQRIGGTWMRIHRDEDIYIRHIIYGKSRGRLEHRWLARRRLRANWRPRLARKQHSRVTISGERGGRTAFLLRLHTFKTTSGRYVTCSILSDIVLYNHLFLFFALIDYWWWWGWWW